MAAAGAVLATEAAFAVLGTMIEVPGAGWGMARAENDFEWGQVGCGAFSVAEAFVADPASRSADFPL